MYCVNLSIKTFFLPSPSTTGFFGLFFWPLKSSLTCKVGNFRTSTEPKYIWSTWLAAIIKCCLQIKSVHMAQYYFLYFFGWIFKIINCINFIWVLNAGQCIDTLSCVMALNISSQTGNIYPRTWSKLNCLYVEYSDFETTGLIFFF